MEAEETSITTESDAEQSKVQRRKNKRVQKDSLSPAEGMAERVKEAEFVVEAVPLPKSNDVLMVEVENIIHDEFQVTEEVKVLTYILLCCSFHVCLVFKANQWFVFRL